MPAARPPSRPRRSRKRLFQDAIAPGETRWYAVDVPAGKRLLVSAGAIPSYDDKGQGGLRTELFDTTGQRLEGDAEVLYGRGAGAVGRVRSQSLAMQDFAGTQALPPGRYTFRVELLEGLETTGVPVEIAVQLLEPGEGPALTREAGELGATPTPTPTSGPERTPVATEAGGPGLLAVAFAGVAGIAVGLVAALALTRRRPA